ncbi:site-specific integrase [Bacteroides eggerthii]|jgi:integrase|uniref:site-specific integrase n=1 Tax=Bacteroides eggerthii TaxID=28111 RepID=UPI0011068E29|nr:site-specific integrase [Bacteroides eggerthii]MBU8974477.1 site-specific integrase [Bacteroides eggerthii]MBU8997257.1 site-specific integrase [Bacteroides eggerthii]MCG4758713.1 site-specific integrase [Bacteroides eggerthii]
MNKIIYNLVYNRKKCLNKKGMALVQVEAYLGRKKKYFSTKVYLKPEQWDNKKLIVKNHPNADALNRLIYEFVATIEKKELELWQQGKRISLELLKNALTTQENNSSFISFFRQEVMNSSLKDSTKRNHLSTLILLQEFKKDIVFSDLTFEFISSFEYFLQLKGYHINTIAKHMKHLKRHVNIAINKEYIEIQKYAFRKYKIKTIENKHTHLVPEELERLENLILSDRYVKLQKSLDAFLFCCYAGMRYSDFINLSSENIVDINQETWLIYKSVKTGTEVRLPLYLLFSGKGIAILNKYRDNLEDFFHLRDNSNVNKDLIIITRLAGLSKRISFHTARHTNATLLIYNGINITTVQKLLGHKSVKTTQVYTNVMDMTIIHDLEKMK